MNYLLQYKKLIRKAQKLQQFRQMNKKLGEYYEKHHILPEFQLIKKKRLNKIIDGKWNLVLLTAREHFIAHLLLWNSYSQIYGTTHILTINAFHAVDNFKRRKADKRANYKISSRIYEKLKKENSKIIKSIRTGKNNPVYGQKFPNKSKKMQGEGNHMFGKKGILSPTYGLKRFGQSAPNCQKYKIYFKNGKIIEILCLKIWCKTNKYYIHSMYDLIKNRRLFYKDIIKVEKLN